MGSYLTLSLKEDWQNNTVIFHLSCEIKNGRKIEITRSYENQSVCSPVVLGHSVVTLFLHWR